MSLAALEAMSLAATLPQLPLPMTVTLDLWETPSSDKWESGLTEPPLVERCRGSIPGAMEEEGEREWRKEERKGEGEVERIAREKEEIEYKEKLGDWKGSKGRSCHTRFVRNKAHLCIMLNLAIHSMLSSTRKNQIFSFYISIIRSSKTIITVLIKLKSKNYQIYDLILIGKSKNSFMNMEMGISKF